MTIEQSLPIPTEKGWPLLGVIPKFLKGDPFEYLRNIMLTQGDLVQLNLGPKPVYLISHPDYLQRILRDNYQNYRRPEMFYGAIRVMNGNGLLTSSGDFWLRQRRMIQPQLHRKQLASLFSEMVETIAEVLDDWAVVAESGDEVELGEKMGDITMNVITRTMFGKGTLPPTEITEIGRRITRIAKYVGETLYSSMLPTWFPIPGQKQFDQDLSATKATVHQIIMKCREEKDTSAGLIRMLLDAVDEESHEQMTEQQLFDEVMTIFTAGHETASTALTWFGVVLHKYPDVREKLQAEADDVLGESRIPSFEDVARLTYTRKVFMEILRMYTIAPFAARALNDPDDLGPYHLPADALLLVFFHGVHHNPSVWDKPEEFNPERFTTEEMSKQHPFAYVPFSAGPRKCAGDEFALLEAPLIMAMALHRYNINILPNQTFAARLGGAMHPVKGVKVTFSRRSFTNK